MTRTVIITIFFYVLVLTGCLSSTDANESCENHDRQEQAAYLEQHAEEEGVTVTESGLQYSILEETDGPVPAATDSVEVEFTGRLIDGSIFDTTDNLPNPLRFKVNDFNVEGVREGLLLMEEGSTYEFVLPSYLGFGETAGGDICPGTTLIFEVTLVDIFN